ncbi:TolB family protein [Aporhodopirellula aestuarii]|uniref:DPP IV N-terminal domain-containing protein n=1 Tax=Aporhodopirellula aestuarii TaxID=2950107 RepID=A0ABT0UDE5_9BACT|nr:DPP IV N-terminal domain-containing protein [Aporhodopirellula aestuarii]MCM2374913.1 DPP IV N-terminal domain-containing protein [Aporhodopirellula aestuarii]
MTATEDGRLDQSQTLDQVGGVEGQASAQPTVAASNPKGTAIYRLSCLGGTCSQLCVTPVSRAGSPSLSPDGTKVAFDGWQTHEGERVSDSHVYSFELSNAQQIKDLGPGAMPSWSLDGERITYSRYDGYRVSIMDAGGTELETLDLNGWSSEWSPDGTMIAYTTRATGYSDIVVYDVSTKNKYTLFSNEQLEFIKWGITWSPDSRRLCVLAHDQRGETQLVVVHVDGEVRERRIISSQMSPEFIETVETPIAWGGDGTHVIFEAKDPDTKKERLYKLNVDGDSPPAPVQGLPEDLNCSEPFWHRDGTILFVGSQDPM